MVLLLDIPIQELDLSFLYQDDHQKHFELQNAGNAQNTLRITLLVNLIKFQYFCEIYDMLYFWGPEAQNTHKPCRLLVLLRHQNAKNVILVTFCEIPPFPRNFAQYGNFPLFAQNE